jgi:hypothetical protein
MKNILIFIMSIQFLTFCIASESSSTKTDTPKLTVIKYSSSRTFEIAGTNFKGIELKDLVKALKRHQTKNQGAEYELLAEVKCVAEESDKIVKTIRGSGIELKHYWAPVGVFDPNDKPGPHGAGYVDLIR